MLSISNLTVQYGENPPALEHFNLEMDPGEIVCIVGESGSGKTTIIRSIMGLLPSNGNIVEGSMYFEGNSLLSYSKEQWRSLRGTKISIIFQDSGAMINPIRKIKHQFVEYIRTHQTMSSHEAENLGKEMLAKMQLPSVDNIMNSYAFQLSGGMRQRVGIAMAMTFQPKLLMADEPTSALDVTTQAQIVRQILELRSRFHTGIILVTHNLGVAAYMADKIMVMKDGHIVDMGKRSKVLQYPQSDYTKKLLASVPALDGERYV